MRKALKIIVTAVLALVLALAGSGALAATMHREVENPDLEIEAVLGYDGVITYGKPVPVRVTVRNRGADFDGVLGMNCYINKKQYDRYERNLSLPSGAERVVVLPVMTETRQDVFTLELAADGRVVRSVNLKADQVVDPAAMLVGVLSTRPEQLKNLDIDQESDTLLRYEYWRTVPLTAETFPAEKKLMNAFGMLVIDDVDPSLLTEAQQAAMMSWLEDGHILLCGGGSRAAKNAAFFSARTGLKAGPVTLSDGVIGALERGLGLVESGSSPQTAIAEITGGTPVIRDAEGRGLIFRSAVGAGSLYTLSFEAGDPRLNADALMHTFWQQLLVKQDASLYSRSLYYGAEYVPAAVSVSRRVEVNSPLLPAVLIVACVPVIGTGAWLILKKRDRQQWMWLALPLLSAAAAAAVAVLSGTSELNQPMMVSAVSLVQEENAPVRSWSGITLAAPWKGSLRISASDGDLAVNNTAYYYYDADGDGDRITEPTRLRTCRTEGAETAVTVEAVRPWDPVSLTLEKNVNTGGRAEASVWMEADGLHGEIRNGTEFQLQEGWVLTSYGYARVPALAPGEKTAFSLVRAEVKNTGSFVYEPGRMYDHRMASVYGVINSIVFGTEDSYRYLEDDSPEGLEKSALYAMLNGMADQIRQDRQRDGGKLSSAGERTEFVYAAPAEGIGETDLKLNGEPVAKKSEIVMFAAEISCLEEGPTGVLFYAAGKLVPERCAVDGNQMPGAPVGETAGNRNYPLSELPTFRFTVPGIHEMEEARISVLFESYYTDSMKAYALNAVSGSWEEIVLNTELGGVERFFDGDDRIYLQFRPLTADSYLEIPAPSMTLEGRRKHAEN